MNDIFEIYYCDGGIAKSHDPQFPSYGSFRSVKICIIDNKEEIIDLGEQHWIKHKNRISTNNQSEVASLIFLLNYLKDNYKKDEVLIRMDSEFVINAVHGTICVTNDSLKYLVKQAQDIINSCSFKIYIHWISGKIMKVVLGH